MTTEQILPLLVGPYGALVLAVVVMWFLYRLYREERQDGREDRAAVVKMSGTIEELVREVRSLREELQRRPARVR